MRDHTKLKVFQMIDDLVMEVYLFTKGFPKEELFGLTSQMRRAAVSAASNIVEGCARQSEADYIHFLNIAYGSLREVAYQASIAFRLKYLSETNWTKFKEACDEASRSLNRLICSLKDKYS